jgi:hypothetical protein
MTDDTADDLPSNWYAGPGEGSRPLSEGGHYVHWFYRTLPGSNQHVKRFLELCVDTAGSPPAEHHYELNYCVETDVEVRRIKRLDYGKVRVADRVSEDAQDYAEERVHAVAEERMKDYADWEP